MTELMMKRIARAKEVAMETFGNEMFIPSMYEQMRQEFETEILPSWYTLKKYADEIGLKAERVAFEWHSDGSMLAEMCGMKNGDIFYHTCYHFE